MDLSTLNTGYESGYGNMADALLKQNTAITASMNSDRLYRPEDLQVIKDEQGNKRPNFPKEAQTDAGYWRYVRDNPDYAKALWETANKAEDGGMSGQPLTINFTDVRGFKVSGQVKPNGETTLLELSPEQMKGLQSDAAKQTEQLNQKVNARVLTLEDAQKKVDTATDTAISAMVTRNSANESGQDTYKTQLEDVISRAKAATEAKVAQAVERTKALANPQGQIMAEKIWDRTLQRQLSLMEQEDKAQARLNFMQTNPLFVAGTAIKGGPEKDSLLQGAKQTYSQLADARTSAQSVANNVLQGLGLMQAISDKQYSVATPEEIRANDAVAVANFVKTATDQQAALNQKPVDVALARKAQLEESFKNLTTIASYEERGIAAVTNAGIRADTAANNIETRKLISDQNDKRARDIAADKIDLAERRLNEASAGISSVAGARIAQKISTILTDSADLPEAEIAGNYKAVLKTNPGLVKDISDFDMGNVDDPIRVWGRLNMIGKKSPGLFKAFPEIQLATQTGQHGTTGWQNMAIVQDKFMAAAMETDGVKGKDEKVVKPVIADSFKLAMIKSINAPDEPLEVRFDNKFLQVGKTGAYGPYKVSPGKYLTQAGQQDSTGLPKATKDVLAENPIAQDLANTEAAYRKIPKTAADQPTIGYEELMASARKVRESRPEIPRAVIAEYVADIYKAGLQLNNTYMAFKAFGLPEQTDYKIRLESETKLGSIATSIKKTTVDDALVAAFPALGKQIEARRASNPERSDFVESFRSKFRNPFSALAGSSTVDLTSATEISNLLLKSDESFWKDRATK